MDNLKKPLKCNKGIYQNLVDLINSRKVFDEMWDFMLHFTGFFKFPALFWRNWGKFEIPVEFNEISEIFSNSSKFEKTVSKQQKNSQNLGNLGEKMSSLHLGHLDVIIFCYFRAKKNGASLIQLDGTKLALHPINFSWQTLRKQISWQIVHQSEIFSVHLMKIFFASSRITF